MSSIRLGSCLLRAILDVQFHFGSNIHSIEVGKCSQIFGVV